MVVFCICATEQVFLLEKHKRSHDSAARSSQTWQVVV